MDSKEIFLKTLFCCSACDGVIAPEEIKLVKELSKEEKNFQGLDIETSLNNYISEINEKGALFLKEFLREINEINLNDKEQIKLIELAIKMIEADNQVLYSEIKFFKKIRQRLTVSDEDILTHMPDKEDYFLPDVLNEDKDFDEIGNFNQISLDEI